jgi:hypothetical protein
MGSVQILGWSSEKFPIACKVEELEAVQVLFSD